MNDASRDDGSARGADITIKFDDNRLLSIVCGNFDQNIARIERRLGVSIHTNGNQVAIKGTSTSAELARSVLHALYVRANSGESLGLGEIDGAIEEHSSQAQQLPKLSHQVAFEHIMTRKRGHTRARNAAQSLYLSMLKKRELVFAEGPAGTGKTWLAVGYAVNLLEQGLIERVIISRPAVEAGERLGFLPGDMREKVDPYLRPIYDALYDFMDARHVERGLQTGMIEVAPLAFMRGRTLTSACVLLDEAQNTTPIQMKMFLTRLGEGSRMIINGDSSQVDLPPGQKSGLAEAIRLTSSIEGVGHVAFSEGDVVRHELVRKIVCAYDAAAKTERPH
jgi:phosphate starvation-inducible PhoH-like protein